MNKSYPERKHPRLKNYDYSQNGCYFVTICVKDKKHLLGSVSVGRDALIPPQTVLSLIGKVAEKYILNIEKTYKSVKVWNYVCRKIVCLALSERMVPERQRP